MFKNIGDLLFTLFLIRNIVNSLGQIYYICYFIQARRNLMIALPTFSKLVFATERRYKYSPAVWTLIHMMKMSANVPVCIHYFDPRKWSQSYFFQNPRFWHNLKSLYILICWIKVYHTFAGVVFVYQWASLSSNVQTPSSLWSVSTTTRSPLNSLRIDFRSFSASTYVLNL